MMYYILASQKCYLLGLKEEGASLTKGSECEIHLVEQSDYSRTEYRAHSSIPNGKRT